MKKIITEVGEYLQSKISIPVVIEPQKISTFEPHLRLSLTGVEVATEGIAEAIHLSGVVYAKGDGPDFFLDSIMNTERKLALECKRHSKVIFSDGSACYLHLEKMGDGSFSTQEEERDDFVTYLSQYKLTIELEGEN